MATPSTRQAARIAAGTEVASPHPELLPRGSLFTVRGGAPVAGSCKFNDNGYTHHIEEAVTDSGVLTWDANLARSLRGMRDASNQTIYTEVRQ